MVSGRTSRAFSLMEVVIAMALLGLVGIALIQVLSTGARASARAGEYQLASLTGARAMDRLLSLGYGELRLAAGTSRELDLAQTTGEPAADGITITGAHAIEQLEPGLLKLTVTLQWRRAGSTSQQHAGTLSVMRYVADPAASIGGAATGGGRTA